MKKDENENENDKSKIEKSIKGIFQFCTGILGFFGEIFLFSIFGFIAVWMYENGVEYVYWFLVATFICIVVYMLMKRKRF